MPPRSTAANVNAEDQEPQSTYGALQADSPLPADTLSNLMGKNGLMGAISPSSARLGATLLESGTPMGDRHKTYSLR